MEYSGIENVESQAVQNDWLDINQTVKQYAEEPQPKQRQHQKRQRSRKSVSLRHLSVFGRVMLSAVAVIVALLAFMWIDGSGQSTVFQAVKDTFTTTFAFLDGGKAEQNTNTIDVPYNVTVSNVENGVITFGGGQALVSFTDGKVTAVDETTVSVALSDDVVIVYGGCTETFVKVGDIVSAYDLLARYKDNATATIVVNGETVVNVVGSENSIKWGV